MVVKPFDEIIGQPTTKTMNIVTGNMAKIVFAVKTTAGGGGGAKVLGTRP